MSDLTSLSVHIDWGSDFFILPLCHLHTYLLPAAVQQDLPNGSSAGIVFYSRADFSVFHPQDNTLHSITSIIELLDVIAC